MSESEEPIDNHSDGGDDLFGDGDDDAPLSEVENVLSDRDLASDRDEDDDDDQRDRRHYGEQQEEPTEFRDTLVTEVPMYRHRIPRSKDNNLVSLRVPEFLKINPREYKAETWKPSKWDLQNANSESPKPSVLFRRDPKTGKMQSNTNIYRWNDGSTTLAVGDEHYEIQTKRLAPPLNKPYQEVQDTHYYAAAAHLTTNSLLIIGHFAEQYTVRPNDVFQDHALERLKATLAEDAKKKQGASEMIVVPKEDPALQQKQAELAEKERAKAQRRRETAAARVDGAGSRYKGGALSIGDLEGGRRGAAGAGGRKRGAPGGGKKKHRHPEYDSDDDLPSGARQNDNYDMEDGFLVDSDEDEEVEDDEEEEEILDDEDEDEAPRTKRRKTTPAPAADEDADAEGDLDDGDVPAHEAASSRRRRHIIDDDDEE
ncbi:Leo1-like protein-domain-containing protein [Apodospora peruviana]|uniref:Leo1-like protein-domain-containing protein n=1 Tax=Apodospora peruviana TaxID=516989 RepID=A0AAE0MDX2_9PEZI|nr:Leo1-like protein-domain-containing protein [Apodospora peruviana]